MKPRALDRLAPAQRATVGTILAGFAAQAFIVVNGILAARALGVEDRGYLGLLWVIGLVVSQLGMLGLPIAATYWMVRTNEPRAVVTRIVRVALIQVLLLTAIEALAMVLIFNDDAPYVLDAALLSLAGMPALIAHQYAVSVLLGLRAYLPFNIFRALPIALYTCALVPLYVSGEADLITVTAAWAAASLIGSGASVLAVKRQLPDTERPSPEPSLTEMMKFGLKGLLGSSSPTDTLQLDQAVVGLFISPSALGLYGVGVSFTSLPRLLGQNLGLVAFPQVAAAPNAREARTSLWRFAGFCLVLCGLVVVAVEATAQYLVPLLFGDAFQDAVPLVRILMAGSLLFALRRVLAEGARGIGRPGLGTIAEVAAWAALLAALPPLAAIGGVDGVAWALVISGAVGLLAMLIGLLKAKPSGSNDLVPRGPGEPEPSGASELPPETPLAASSSEPSV